MRALFVFSWLFTAIFVVGCEAPPGGVPDAAPSPDAAPPGDAVPSLDATADGEVVFDAADAPEFDADTWASLEQLVLSPGPAPADITNRFADDDGAARLGQRLFFDPGFSGTLLDGDNNPPHNATGLQGETGRVSCASCHVPEDGFVDSRTVARQISLGAGWTFRRAPSILDVAQATLLMWDGRFDTLQRQALAVIESPMEANSSRLFFAQEIARRYGDAYAGVFGDDPSDVLGAPYPQLTAETTGCVLPDLGSTTTPDEACTDGELHGVPGDGAEYDSLSPEEQRRVTTIALNAGRALGAYQRRLSCGPGRFDAFMGGDADALSAAEQRGAALFVGRGQCVNCHSGPFLSDQRFHNVGLVPRTVAGGFLRDNDEGAQAGFGLLQRDPLNSQGEFADGDDGRVPSEIDVALRGAFRTPTLRCVASRPSYMHSGQIRRLREVVDHFNAGGMIRPDEGEVLGFLGQNVLEPLGLSESDVDDLVAFLESLEGAGPPPELLVDPGL